MRYAAVIAGALAASAGVGAQAPTGTLLVLNKAESTLAIVDPRSGTVLGRVPTGEGPHEVAVSADGRLALVTNYGAATPGASLSVIDVAARKEVRRVELGALRRPHGIVVLAGGAGPLGGKAVFTAESARAIAAYDPAANRVDWQFETGQDVTHMVVASRDGRRLFTSNMGSNTIGILEATGPGWRQRLVTVGPGPEGLDLSPDERELWTAHSRDGGVSVVDVAAGKVVHTIDAGTRRANRLKFTRDGDMALVSDLDRGEVVFIDAKSRRVIKRLPVGRMAEGILIPPTGDRAYVAVTSDNRIAAIDLRTLDVVQTIATGEGPDGMAWGR